MRTVVLKIVHTETGEVVETMDVSKHSEHTVDKILYGLLVQMNHDEYHVEEVEA